MLQTFQCLNCCGQRTESVYYQEICPTCGELMTLPRYNLDEMLISSGSAAYTEQNRCQFISIGSLLSDEPMLLSYAMNQRYVIRALEKDNLVALFVRPDDVKAIAWDSRITAIYSQHPQVDFFLFHNWLVEKTDFYGVDTKTEFHFRDFGKAVISHHNVFIGEKAWVYPGACVLDNVILESDSIIAPGVIIGVDGARLIKKPDGTFLHALHGGGVHVGERAYVGANAVVVRSLWRKPTTIGAGAFVGNLVNVGHNVTIESGAVVLTGAILGGRAHITSTACINLGAIIRPGVRVAGTVQMGAVVTQDVPEGVTVSGNFAVEHELQIGHVKRLAAWGPR